MTAASFNTTLPHPFGIAAWRLWLLVLPGCCWLCLLCGPAHHKKQVITSATARGTTFLSITSNNLTTVEKFTCRSSDVHQPTILVSCFCFSFFPQTMLWCHVSPTPSSPTSQSVPTAGRSTSCPSAEYATLEFTAQATTASSSQT